MTSLVLQGRLDSKRLPGKSLLPLGGKALIYRVMQSLKHIPCDKHVLACPDDCLCAFAPLAQDAGFEVCTGSKEDVLARYCDAIRRFNPEWVIRATADNPFVFIDSAKELAQEAIALDADYAAYAGLPLGAGVEVVKASALLKAESEAKEQYEREHVCPYLYGHPELFYLHRPLAPLKRRNLKLSLTVDTQKDFDYAIGLYEALNNKTQGKKDNINRYYGETILEAACK